MAGGDFGLSAATIERAMRIEPDNPLLWIELGRVRYTAGDASQAESMGRKALALASGDPRAQSSAWHLIADSLRSLRRNPEAAEADKKANALSGN
jgi:cytochrome c-type biogenesis protein CcmH/NrfG